jgi:hypothetical protein
LIFLCLSFLRSRIGILAPFQAGQETPWLSQPYYPDSCPVDLSSQGCLNPTVTHAPASCVWDFPLNPLSLQGLGPLPFDPSPQPRDTVLLRRKPVCSSLMLCTVTEHQLSAWGFVLLSLLP